MQIKAIRGWHDPHVRVKPTPPASEYDQWLSRRNIGWAANRPELRISGSQLRRAVIMRKQGETWKDCAAAIGSSAKTIKNWLEFLPLDLAP